MKFINETFSVKATELQLPRGSVTDAKDAQLKERGWLEVLIHWIEPGVRTCTAGSGVSGLSSRKTIRLLLRDKTSRKILTVLI